MKEKFMKFMKGRYGSDNLTKALLSLVIVFFILNLITRMSIFNTLAIVFIVYGYYRMFSKNIPARYAENQRYLKAIAPLKSKYFKLKRRWTDGNSYKYIKCSECSQELRVPKGKGRINVTCSKCKNKFEVRS